MEEYVTEPEVTSGTPAIVVTEDEQVIVFARLSAMSATSSGSVVDPITKHAFWRREMDTAGTAAAAAAEPGRGMMSLSVTNGILGRAVAAPTRAMMGSDECMVTGRY